MLGIKCFCIRLQAGERHRTLSYKLKIVVLQEAVESFSVEYYIKTL